MIVLGAGLAGLRCAQVLTRKHGFGADQVVLLEASTRIGGRIKTDTSFVEGFSVGSGVSLLSLSSRAGLRHTNSAFIVSLVQCVCEKRDQCTHPCAAMYRQQEAHVVYTYQD